MHRLAYTLFGCALALLLCLAALLLGDAFAPARLSLLLACVMAGGAGLALFLGLWLLEPRAAVR